jgi:hypothetical protein
MHFNQGAVTICISSSLVWLLLLPVTCEEMHTSCLALLSLTPRIPVVTKTHSSLPPLPGCVLMKLLILHLLFEPSSGEIPLLVLPFIQTRQHELQPMRPAAAAAHHLPAVAAVVRPAVTASLMMTAAATAAAVTMLITLQVSSDLRQQLRCLNVDLAGPGSISFNSCFVMAALLRLWP